MVEKISSPSSAESDEETAPPSGLAASQLRRLRRILDAAKAMAEEGGFEGVRLRDVAEASGVALGTLYRYFRSKEDILLLVLAEDVGALEEHMAARPAKGKTARERTVGVFVSATKALTSRPAFARAVLRAVASGDSETTEKVASFHLRVSRLVLNALSTGDPETEHQRAQALILQQVWFASLVGWSGGVHSPRQVIDQVDTAASLLLGAQS